ncbi:glycosyltransferase [Pseudoflavonifractor sp. SW1122]|uniref:glycosyltransferase n=1 Tax=Pseudoflavonifractor sp. SW1122 TaxID=2530044 RepID=UPI00325B8FC4
MPRVSIIMGIYNCGKTLGEAIDSLLAQTYTDWKLIMCDDGSVDDTYSVAQRYVQQYPDKMVLLRNEKNMGLNYTLNHCLSVADGELIARMDGDDISVPERFEREVEFLDAHPKYAIVSSCMHYFDGEGIFRTGVGRGEPSLESIARATPFCHAPCMVRAEAYQAVNGYAVDEKRLRVEDWDLWVRMYELGYRGYMLDDPLYMMRDDRNAFARRKFRYRINEARVTMSAVKKLKLSKKNYIWVLRPIIVGLLPKFIYDRLHRFKLN